MCEESYSKENVNILLLENISPEAVAAFKGAGYAHVRSLSAALDEDALIEALKDVQILGIRSKTRISKRVIQSAPQLLVIGCFCIGTNQVDKVAATESGVVVFNAPYSNTRSVAELVIGAAIMLIRRIPEKQEAALKGIWLKDSLASHELRGKTLGIVGYGNIGSQVSVLAESLGMQVVYFDVEKKLPLGNARPQASLEAVLCQADIITLHIPATQATNNCINAERLATCKKGALLINYARGEVVDIDAVRVCLQHGQLGGAAIDVFLHEPEKNGAAFHTPLHGLPNVLLTPHIGGSTEEAQASIAQDVSSKLLSFIERGNTQGSLTVPELILPLQEEAHRILHIHHNRPGVLSALNSSLSSLGINILGQYLKTNERIGYVVLDVDMTLSGKALDLLREVPESIKVRVVY